MENTEERYGDLTDKEYAEFLAEIENGDEEIEEAQSQAVGNIELEEELSGISENAIAETQENADIEAFYGDDAWRKFGKFFFGKPEIIESYKKAAKTIKAKQNKRKEQRIAIQRMAFNQEYVRLSDPVGNDNFKLLISLLTSEHSRMIEKYSAYINKRLAFLINPLIPRRIRICKMLYPDSMRENPGFLYRASKEYGEEQTFWATPNIPYFFKQNTEQQKIHESARHINYLINIDKAVASYNTHTRERAKKELKYASTLIRKGVYTYFDLLKLNPFWFELLFNEIKDKINKQQ